MSASMDVDSTAPAIDESLYSRQLCVDDCPTAY